MNFPGKEPNVAEIVGGESYKALQKIKAIIEDDSLTDRECFVKVDEVVCVLESVGKNGSRRHDLG